MGAALVRTGAASTLPLTLPEAHRRMVQERHRRIVLQYDADDVLWKYWNLQRGRKASFERFRDALFSYADEPGSQIDAIWWDIGGSPFGSPYPSKILPPHFHPLVRQWLDGGVDWVEQLVRATRSRKLEVFWNHRICEVECLIDGGLTKEKLPLKVEHPDWVVPATWWPQGMWNLAAPGLREYKISVLRELAGRYDLDGIQIDFSRHLPCLPTGRQWELRDQVTEFMRMARQMILEVAGQRGRPLLLAAKVPQNLAGCRVDGFDLRTWAEQGLVDVLTLGSRSMDVDVEGIRAAVGNDVQLQPCVDDHHASDGYRNPSIEGLRGIFANHFQRGANSVVTFNWSFGPAQVCHSMGIDLGWPGGAASGPPQAGLQSAGGVPAAQQVAYHEAGDPRTLAHKDKYFAVERRGGYPWCDGYFNRNDDAPLPLALKSEQNPARLTLHISDSPTPGNSLFLRLILFQAHEDDTFKVQLNGVALTVSARDPEWKDPQILSPKPQPNSGGKGLYQGLFSVDPQQRLLRLDCAAPREAWRRGQNEVTISVSSRREIPATSPVHLEKLEAHLHYA